MKPVVLSMMAISLMLSLSGCLADQAGVSTVDIGKPHAYFVEADKRVVVSYDGAGIFCTEPSPDVKTDLSDTVKQLLEASAKLPNTVDASVKEQFERTSQMITTALISRSQGLQLQRDILFQACLAQLRGDISKETYTQIMRATLASSASVIVVELLAEATKQGHPLTDAQAQSILNFVMLTMAQPS
jgi:hypothetical protein